MNSGIVDRTLVDTAERESASGSTGTGTASVSAGGDNWFPSPEDVFESTTNYAKPLRALERMRRITRNSIEAAAGLGGADGGLVQALSHGRGHGHGHGARASRGNPKSRRGPMGAGVGTMDVFAVLAQINDQLGSATDLDTFLKVRKEILFNNPSFVYVIDWG